MVRGGVSPGLLDGRTIGVDPADGPAAEQRGGDGQHAGSAADVEHARRVELRSKLDEELEAQPRGRVPARPERARRLDHHRDRVLRWSLPARADPERADADGAVEVAPPLLPARRDLGLDDVAECGSNLGRSGGIGVRGELESAASIAFLEPGREESDEDGTGDFGLGSRNLDRDAPEIAQRKTLFSLSKKPSSSR